MITTKPNCGLDDRFNQKQAAELLGVDRHTVRRYEQNGNLKFKVRKASRQKYTTGRQIIQCWEASYL